ncbi:type VI secretion system lipoprotein TssJ [Arcobacter defluvii]|uniref:Type VI secretion system, membrane platform protein n=1 Tax=Arcobacter defluvii TaxID=873191 RepID=A0AAE7E7M1_9BACT|nr:type VI secretion system lipoprotein TssJ [Arcobacter defluvii]QKF78261.1 type VI secretion system, membrane platform protein [Arcobacter defluvii]RXI29068.1 type VI secretion system lipoprotein TssJ [Arcobacter defluvii]
MYRNFSRFILILISTFFIIGCAKDPTHLELVLKSGDKLNLDIDDRSSPLMVTFYELESAEKFMKYDYWTILDDKESLKNDLISQSKHVILANQLQNYKIAFNNKARYLGILCNFRIIDNDYTWKSVIDLKKSSYNFGEFEINKFNMQRVDNGK